MPDLHVERTGAGDPVVFLHGVGSSGATYGWLPELGRTVVRPDFRGHGRSERTPGAYLIGDYADDVVSVLRDTGPAALVGHSLGGVAAWTVAQRHPELVTAIVLEDPPLYMGEPAEHARNAGIPIFKAVQAAAARWQEQGTAEREIMESLAAQPYGPDGALTVGEIAAEDATAARAYALRRLDLTVLDVVIDGSLLAATDVVAPVAVPALILAADVAFGGVFGTRHAERLAVTHPDVRVDRVPRAAHSIHDDRSLRARYLRAVREFLSDRGGGSARAR